MLSFPFQLPPANDNSRAPRWNLVRQLAATAEYLRQWRTTLRYGELSRAPLELVRLEIQGERVECDWLLRKPDLWDAHIMPITAQRHFATQALQDALAIRTLLFSTLPHVDVAQMRGYRSMRHGPPELVLTGCSERSDRPRRVLLSLAMRAQLAGFRFTLENGVLLAPPPSAERPCH
jgi:hypothetical protein